MSQILQYQTRETNPYSGIAPTIISLKLYHNFLHSQENSIGIVDFLIVSEIGLVWSIMYPAFPCLRPVALKFNTAGVTVGDTFGSSLDKSAVVNTASSGRDPDLVLRSDGAEHVVKCHHEPEITGDDISLDSFGSGKQFIRRTTEITQS